MNLQAIRYRSLACFISILVLVATSSCRSSPEPTATPSPEPINPGLTLGVPCEPPCWLDIQPGVTTLQEAEAILQQYIEEGIVLSWSDHTQGECDDVGLVVWDVFTHPRYADGFIAFVDGLVFQIAISPPDESYTYTLGELVERYGPPELVSGESGGRCECHSYPQGERFQKVVYYLSNGMQLVVTGRVSMHGCMCPNMVVEWARFFEPMSFSELQPLLDPIYSPSDTPPPYTYCDNFLAFGVKEPLIEWHGFGSGY